MTNYRSIQNNCRFKIVEAYKKIFQLSENTWAVYSVGTISMNEVCPASNDVTEMQIQSGDTIKIKPGCYVCTMDHVILADESETIKVKIKAVDWAGRSRICFITETRRQSTRYNGKFYATILLDQLDHLHILDPRWAFNYLAAMIWAAICIFAIGICLWRLCCRARENPTPTPSTPPMRMPVRAPQPAATPRAAPALTQKPATNN
jgi:hypothetical protein